MSKKTTQQPSLCQHCIMSGMCFSKVDKSIVELKVRSHKVYHKSDVLFGAGQTFDAIYILRSGSAKSSVIANSGHEQISSFHYPGDLIGLDGFDNGSHAQSIKFLETSSVCRIGLGELDKAMAIETVSRLLTLLQNENIIEVEKRRVKIMDLGKLNQCLLHERGPHMLLAAKVRQPNNIQARIA